MSTETPPDQLLQTAVEATTVQQPNITHDAEFWFDDGSIVLVARDVGFRVYRALLAAQSELFKAMFEAPHSAVDESIEGCPVVRMTDSPEDLRYLLRAILPKDGKSYWSKTPPHMTFDELFAVVRLSHKYGFCDLQHNGMDLLSQLYPNTLDGYWRRFQCRAESSYAIGAVNLALLTNTPSVLAVALYQCCLLEEAVMDGWTRKDGTIERLSDTDLKRCLKAQRLLAQEHTEIAWACASMEPGEECDTLFQCQEAMKDIRSNQLHVGLEECEAYAALDYDFDRKYPEDLERLCSACHSNMVSIEDEGIREVWSRLPQIFGITVPGW